MQIPRPIAITMGDAAGIGPEIIAKAYQQEPLLMSGTFVAGDVQTMRRACAMVARTQDRIALPVAALGGIDDVAATPAHCVPVLQVAPVLGDLAWGQVNARAGAFAGHCLFWAANAALRGEIGALVTAPIHKEALHAAGAPFDRYPGHTEMLQAAAAEYLHKTVDEVPVRMMLANDELRVVLVSIHMALRQAIDAVTTESVFETLMITHDALSRHLGRAPRIAVAGLNPHAGEGGLFGHEEMQWIAPAIAQARAKGCQASGPFAPDTVFMRARRHASHPHPEFDAVVAMYHDQGLIPVKYLGVDKGVNVTLGLPMVRTSPDHGTAFDIAGLGKADPASLIEAVRVAKSMRIS